MKKYFKAGKELVAHINEADVIGLSAQLAYFFLLSVFPFLLFLVTLLGFFPIDDRAFIEYIAAYLPNDVVSMIESNLNNILNNRSGSLLSVSIVGTLWSASNGFNAITKSFNKAYRVDENRSFILNRLIAIGLMIGLILMIAVALLLSVFGKVIGEQIFAFIGLDEYLNAWNIIRWVATSVTFFIALLLIYKLAPNEKVLFRHALAGAVFATVFWQLTSLAFSFYVNTLGNYSATYGSLGTVIVLMVWFYLFGIIITTGGVINAFVKEREEAKEVVI